MNPGLTTSEPRLGAATSLTLSRSGRLPSLDGIRALSIALVLVAHLVETRNFLDHRLFWVLGDIGNLGVRVFFVISGFLITNLLLKEHEANGRISLKDFYVRRVLRIFPAFYLFVGCMVAASALGLISLGEHDLVYAVTYTINHYNDRSWYMAHLWSLAVEEQFYLMWPCILVILGRYAGLWVAAGMLIAAPITRTVIFYALPSWRPGVGCIFPTVADALATGCILAGARAWLGGRPWYVRFLSSRTLLAVPAFLFVTNAACRVIPWFSLPIGQTILNIGIAICIDRWVTYPSGTVGGILNSRPFVFMGTLSYSIYLWQQPFLNHRSESLACVFPINLVLVMAAALGSYYLVERPLLRLRSRFRR